MKFTSLLYLAASASTAFASHMNSNSARKALDVFVPDITSPQAGDHWLVGEQYVITWRTDDAPQQITNERGQVRIRHHDRTLPLILADGFPIMDGHVQVTAPWLDDGNYTIVLFGDSGNFSPEFALTKKA